MKNKIIIYRFTGKQGFFTIPKKWCAECDLLIMLVSTIINEHGLGDKTDIIIRPWFIWFLIPLYQFKTVYAPILIINGKLISAGIVPSKEKIINALT